MTSQGPEKLEEAKLHAWKRIVIIGGLLAAVVFIATPWQGLSISEMIVVALAGVFIGFIWSVP